MAAEQVKMQELAEILNESLCVPWNTPTTPPPEQPQIHYTYQLTTWTHYQPAMQPTTCHISTSPALETTQTPSNTIFSSQAAQAVGLYMATTNKQIIENLNTSGQSLFKADFLSPREREAEIAKILRTALLSTVEKQK